MENMEYFLKFFGSITVKDVVYFMLAAVFLFFCYRKVSKFLVDKYEAEKLKSQQLSEALEAVRKYPEYRQQSINIQKKLEDEIAGTKELQNDILKRLTKMEDDSARRERNKCRDLLLQNFRYFSGKETNPLQAWTRMESEAFWELFKDYEDASGNGYVHTEVQPVMNRLEIIEMDDKDRVAELMHSRG